MLGSQMRFERSKLSWQVCSLLPIWFRLPTNPPAFLHSRRLNSALNSAFFFCFLRTATRTLISESKIELDRSSALLAVVWSATTSTTRESSILGGSTSIAFTSRWSSNSASLDKSLFYWGCNCALLIDCSLWSSTQSTVGFLARSPTGLLPFSAKLIAASICISNRCSVVSLTGVFATSCCSDSCETWELASYKEAGSPCNDVVWLIFFFFSPL